MRDIPVNLGGYKLMVTEEPTLKIRTDEGTGEQAVATNRRDGSQQYVVSLFAKKRPEEGEYAQKGEEIRVTLLTDPGEGFEEGTYVELHSPTVSHWQNERRGRYSSGLSFKALGLKPV